MQLTRIDPDKKFLKFRDIQYLALMFHVEQFQLNQ